jgi:hypothetical protein
VVTGVAHAERWGDDRRCVIALFLVAVALGITARLTAIMRSTTLWHNDAVGFMEATGHTAQYYRLQAQGAYPFHAWVRAADWKRFIRPEQPFPFRQISHDQARYDVHPPLFYWVLYLWDDLWGTHTWTGPTLNLIFDGLTLGLVYRMGVALLDNRRDALIVAAIWIMGPTSITTSLEARHYSLYTLLTVLFADSVFRYFYKPAHITPGVRGFALVTLSALAGMLTHYYFALAMAGAGLAVGLRSLTGDRRRIALLVVCLACAGGLFVLIHPDFWLSFKAQRKLAEPFTWPRFRERVCYAGFMTLSMFAHRGFVVRARVPIVLFLGLAGMIVLALGVRRVVVSRHRARVRLPALKDLFERPDQLLSSIYVLCMLAGLYICVVLFYLLFLSHEPTLKHYRYLSPAWLFVSFLPAMIVRLKPFHAVGNMMLLVFFGWLLVAGPVLYIAADVWHWLTQASPHRPLPASGVVIDHEGAEWVLSIVSGLDDDNPVFVADQPELVANPHPWLGTLASSPGFYVNILSRDRPEDLAPEIIGLMERSNLSVVETDDWQWTNSTAYTAFRVESSAFTGETDNER